MSEPNTEPTPTPSNTSTGSEPEVTNPSANTEPTGAEPTGPTIEQLQAEMVRDRFDAAAARAGVDEGYTDVALALFNATGKEPTKANMAKFIAGLKKSKPALFGPQPANTSPTPTTATPAAPAPGGVTNPYQQWRSLVAAGRKAEAESF